MPLSGACTVEEKLPFDVSPVTAAGNPSTVDGVVSVEAISGTGTVEVVDGLHFFLLPSLGDTVYRVSGDADLGAGVKTIEDTVTITGTSAQADHFGLNLGSAVPR